MVVPKAEAVRVALGRVWRLWTRLSRGRGPGTGGTGGEPRPVVPGAAGAEPMGKSSFRPAASVQLVPPTGDRVPPLPRLQLTPPSRSSGVQRCPDAPAPVAFPRLPRSWRRGRGGTLGASGPTHVQGEQPGPWGAPDVGSSGGVTGSPQSLVSFASPPPETKLRINTRNKRGF